MHYRWTGNGKNVVLLHMSGSSSDEFEQVGGLLGQQFRVYAVDLLGFGSSDPPPRFYSFRDHARTVVSFMDALGIDRAYFAGNLVGANLSVHIAAEYPERVDGLMLGQTCYDPDPQYYADMRHSEVFSEIKVSDDGSHLQKMWARSAKYGESAVISDDRMICLHRARQFGETLHWALCEDAPIGTLLDQVRVPTVVTGFEKCGKEDRQRELAGKISGAVFERIAGATPYVARANPKEYAAVFLRHFGES